MLEDDITQPGGGRINRTDAIPGINMIARRLGDELIEQMQLIKHKQELPNKYPQIFEDMQELEQSKPSYFENMLGTKSTTLIMMLAQSL